MAKEREKIKLKPVDEESVKERRYLRLHADAVEEVEEVEDLPPVRVGQTPAAGDGVEPGRARVKARSNEPDIASLIERDEIGQESRWESAQIAARNLPWGWAVLVACIFAGGILWSLWSVTLADKKQEFLTDQTERIFESEQKEEQDAERLIAEIEIGVRGFFGAGSVEEMLRFVRHPERIAPLMGKHYGESPPVPGGLMRFRGFAPLTISNYASFWIASCELRNGEIVQILVEMAESGHAKVDWETYVLHQPMPWDEFARSRPGGYTGDFRVYVEMDNYYSHEFADSKTFTSFRLTTPDGEESLNGYVPNGEVLEREISDLIMRNGGTATPMILRLFVPKNLESKRGVVVEKVVSPRWVFVDNPEKKEP